MTFYCCPRTVSCWLLFMYEPEKMCQWCVEHPPVKVEPSESQKGRP